MLKAKECFSKSAHLQDPNEGRAYFTLQIIFKNPPAFLCINVSFVCKIQTVTFFFSVVHSGWVTQTRLVTETILICALDNWELY